MKRGKKQIAALDADDVLFPCIPKMAEEARRRGMDVRDEDFTDYRFGNFPEEYRTEFLRIMQEPSFYMDQEPFPGAVEMVEQLTDAGHEVLIASAVPPLVMSERSKRLLTFFTTLKPENIMLGSRKDLLHVDFLLDDALHNITKSPAKYPVVFNRSWNSRAQDYLRVHTYQEFINLVEAVSLAPGDLQPKLNRAGCPGIICLVGPSAAGKSYIVDEIVQNPLFRKIRAITTRSPRPGEREGEEYHFVSLDTFNAYCDRGDLVESTVYCGSHYGVAKEEIREIWHDGRIAIKPMDINGALACKKAFGDRCVTVFVRRNKEDIVRSILSRSVSNEDKANRLLSLDHEMENEALCDWTVSNNGSLENAVRQILRIVG